MSLSKKWNVMKFNRTQILTSVVTKWVKDEYFHCLRKHGTDLIYAVGANSATSVTSTAVENISNLPVGFVDILTLERVRFQDVNETYGQVRRNTWEILGYFQLLLTWVVHSRPMMGRLCTTIVSGTPILPPISYVGDCFPKICWIPEIQ